MRRLIFILFLFGVLGDGFGQVDTALFNAVKINDITLVKQLIAQGSDTNGTDENGANSLMWATHSADLPLVKYLVSKGASLSPRGVIYTNEKKTGYYGNLTSIAAALGKIDMLQYFIEELNIPVDDKEYNPEEKKQTGWTALQWTASSGQLESVKFLLSKGADINVDEGSCLLFALASNHDELAAFFIEKSIVLNSEREGFSAIHYAARGNKIDIIHLLQEYGAGLNAQTSQGWTALMLAAYNDHLESCFWLNYYGAALNLKDNDNQTSADYAKEKSSVHIFLQDSNNTFYESIATTCNNRLVDLYNRGHYNFAIPIGLIALKHAEKSLGKEHASYGICLNNLAALYKQMGRYAEAEPLYEQALLNTEKSLGKEHAEYGIRLNNLAALYESMGRYAEAEQLLLKSNKNVQNILYTLQSINETNQKKYLAINLSTFEYFQSFIYSHSKHAKDLKNNCFNNNIQLKNLLLDNKKRLLNLLYESKDRTMSSKAKKWFDLQEVLISQANRPVQKRIVDIDSLKTLSSQLENELARTSKKFRQATKQIIWQDLQKGLQKDEAILEISHFQYRNNTNWTDSTLYVAYLVTPESKQVQSIFLFEEKAVDTLFQKATIKEILATQLYRNVTPLRGTKQIKHKNLSFIWEALLPHIQQYKTLYISPSGILNEINLGAIPIDKDTLQDSLAMDLFKIYQYNSLRVLTEERSSDVKDFLLVGGINYMEQNTTSATDTISDQELTALSLNNYANQDIIRLRAEAKEEWQSLEGTKKEIVTISNLLEQESYTYRIITGTNASEASIKESLSQATSPSVVHLSTHGFFFPNVQQKKEDFSSTLSLQDNIKTTIKYSENPMVRSGLILAGANKAWTGEVIPTHQEDGILTASEVANLNLRNTELVVLSACETGLGDIHGSEGVYGLQRAFKMAGAKNLLMSLWKVPDAATQELMTTFYSKWLVEQLPLRDAFLEAQQAMRIQYPEEPYMWAGFVLVE